MNVKRKKKIIQKWNSQLTKWNEKNKRKTNENFRERKIKKKKYGKIVSNYPVINVKCVFLQNGELFLLQWSGTQPTSVKIYMFHLQSTETII